MNKAIFRSMVVSISMLTVISCSSAKKDAVLQKNCQEYLSCSIKTFDAQQDCILKLINKVKSESEMNSIAEKIEVCLLQDERLMQMGIEAIRAFAKLPLELRMQLQAASFEPMLKFQHGLLQSKMELVNMVGCDSKVIVKRTKTLCIDLARKVYSGLKTAVKETVSDYLS